MAFRVVSSPVQQQKPRDMGIATALLRGLLDDVRRTLGSGVEAGFKIGDRLGMGNADRLGVSNPFLDQQEVQNIRTKPVEQSVKNLLGIGAFFVPFGKAQGFRGALAPGALSGLMSTASQDNSTVGDLVKGAGTGALTAGVLNKLLGGRAAKVADEATGTGNRLEQMGATARRKVLNPQTSNAPYAASEEKAALALQEKLGLKGSGRQQLEQVDRLYSQWNDDIKSIIDAGSNRAESKVRLASRIRNFVNQEGQNFIPGDQTYETLLNRELTKFERSVAGDAATAKDIFAFKNRLASNYKNAFKKASGDSASALTAPESVALDVWKSLDNLLVDLEPGVKDLTVKQSQLYDISPGLVKKAKETAQIPITGGRVGTGPLQAFEDFTGRTLQSAGRAIGGGPQTATQPAVSNALKQLMLRAGVPGAAALGGQDTVPGAQTSSPITETPTNGNQVDSQQVLKQLLAAGVLSGKISSSDVTALQSLGLLDSGKPEKLTEAQQARADVGNLSSQALRALETGSIKTGPIAPKFENLKAVFNAGDENTVAFNTLIASIKASIAKARAGTSFTPNEEKLLNQYTPNVGDSEQQLRIKLQGLQQLFPAQ